MILKKQMFKKVIDENVFLSRLMILSSMKIVNLRTEEFVKANIDLSSEEYQVLDLARFMKSINLEALSQQMNLDMVSINKIVTVMMERGILAKERDDIDRRRLNIVVTTLGKDMHNKAMKIESEMVNTIFSSLSQDELHTFSQTMSMIAIK